MGEVQPNFPDSLQQQIVSLLKILLNIVLEAEQDIAINSDKKRIWISKIQNS